LPPATAGSRITASADEAIVGRCHYEVLPETPQKWREGHARVLRHRPRRALCADSYRHASGRVDWLRWEGPALSQQLRRYRRHHHISEFITDRVEAETLRRDSEEKLADYLARQRLVLETDADHRIIYDFDRRAHRRPDRGAAPRPVTALPIWHLSRPTHWELAGIRKPHETPAWQPHLADLSARRPFRDFPLQLTAVDGRVTPCRDQRQAGFRRAWTHQGYRGNGAHHHRPGRAERELIRQSEQLTFAGRLDRRRLLADGSAPSYGRRGRRKIYCMIGRAPAAFTPTIANRFDIPTTLPIAAG
jgi:hypothetical protein